MARASGKTSRNLRMVPLGEPGPRFRPDQDYFSVSLVAIHLPGSFLNMTRFAPVVWSSVRYFSHDGEKTLVGMYPRTEAQSPDFARKDRIEVQNLQLTPRIVAREELTVGFTLGQMKEKDYLGGALKFVTELANSPAAAFISQIAPAIGMVKGTVQTAERVLESFRQLSDQDKLQALGGYNSTLRAPLGSGLVAFVDDREDVKALRFDEAQGVLLNGGNPVKTPHAVLRLVCDPGRPDWMMLPDLNQAWGKIREAALAGGDVRQALEYFRITAVTSPDLTRFDADRLAEAAQQKFAPVLSGEESAVFDDPGDMAESLTFFLNAGSGAESATLTTGGARAAAAAVTPALFDRCLEIVLEHEGGFVDHPNDPGGATNRGVTQQTYDAYRKKKGLPKRTVKELEDTECGEIYFQGFWRPAKCMELPNDALALLTFDSAVNHGPRQALKLLQQAAGMPDGQCDGLWGANTRTRVITAAANAQALAEAFLLKRERLYRRIVEANPRLGAFLRGWMNRIVSLRETVQPMLAGAPPAGDTEGALYSMDGARTPLATADPDFTDWTPDVIGTASDPVLVEP